MCKQRHSTAFLFMFEHVTLMGTFRVLTQDIWMTGLHDEEREEREVFRVVDFRARHLSFLLMLI